MNKHHTNQDNYEYDDEPFEEADSSDGVDYLIYDDGYIEQEPRWTRRRIVLFVIALLIITAIIVVALAPFLQNLLSPVPGYIPPLATPASQL